MLHPCPGRPGTFIDDTDGRVITICDFVEASRKRCSVCGRVIYTARNLFCENHIPEPPPMPRDT